MAHKTSSLEIDFAYEVARNKGGVNTYLKAVGNHSTPETMRYMIGPDIDIEVSQLESIEVIELPNNTRIKKAFWNSADSTVFLITNPDWEAKAVHVTYWIIENLAKEVSEISLNIHYPDSIGNLLINSDIKKKFTDRTITICKYLHSYDKAWTKFLVEYAIANPKIDEKFNLENQIQTSAGGHQEADTLIIEADKVFYANRWFTPMISHYFPNHHSKFIFKPLPEPIKNSLLVKKQREFSEPIKCIFASRRAQFIKGIELFPELLEKLEKSPYTFVFTFYFLLDEYDTKYWNQFKKELNSKASKNITIVLKETYSDNHDEYITELNQSDIAIMPSLWEAWGYSIVEAVKTGIKVITSNQSGYIQYLQQVNQVPNNVLLYKSNLNLQHDVAEITKLLKILLSQLVNPVQQT